MSRRRRMRDAVPKLVPRPARRSRDGRTSNAAAALLQFFCVGTMVLPAVDAFCSPVAAGRGSTTSTPTTTARRYGRGGHNSGTAAGTSRSTPTCQLQRRRTTVTAAAASQAWHAGGGGWGICGSGAAICGSFSDSLNNSCSSGWSSSFVSRDGITRSGRRRWSNGRTGRTRSSQHTLGMVADQLSVLGSDALTFLAATVAVVPLCKKLNIRFVRACCGACERGIDIGFLTEDVIYCR